MQVASARHEGLHVLRGISLLLVLLTHLSLPSTILSKISKNIVNPFYWGAELFLILSGFLITDSIISGRVTSLKEFIIKRTCRIYPPLLIYVIIAFVINLLVFYTIDITESNKTIIAPLDVFFARIIYLLTTLAYISSQDLGYHFAQMWSVVIEIQYYIVIAFIVLPISRKIGKLTFTTLYIVLLVAVITLRIFNVLEIPAGIPAAQYLAEMNVDFIAAGGLLAVWWSRKQHDDVYVSKYVAIRIGSMIAVTCVILMFLPSPMSTLKFRYINHIIILCNSIYIFLLMLNYPRINKNVILRALLYMGDISYSVYLYHFTIFVVIWWIVVLYAPFMFYKALAYEITQILGLSLSVIILSKVFIAIERKSIALGSRLYKLST